jgi:hypothetical protein
MRGLPADRAPARVEVGDNALRESVQSISLHLGKRGIQRRPAMEPGGVRVLDLGKEQPVRADPPFGRGEAGDEGPEPLLAAAVEITGRQRIGERLEPGGVAAGQKHVPGLAEGDPLGGPSPRQPVMLIETAAPREGPGGADADEHPAPLAVQDVEVVRDRPAPFELQMPAVLFVAMSWSTALLTGYRFRYVLKNPTTRSGCWNG